MVNQYDPFGPGIENIGARKIPYKDAFSIDHGHRAPAGQRALYLAHRIFWPAGVELAVHDILCADA